jgi:hypothetical protein
MGTDHPSTPISHIQPNLEEQEDLSVRHLIEDGIITGLPDTVRKDAICHLDRSLPTLFPSVLPAQPNANILAPFIGATEISRQQITVLELHDSSGMARRERGLLIKKLIPENNRLVRKGWASSTP